MAAAARYTANDTTSGDGLNTGGFRFNAGLPVDLNAHTARFDWNVTSDARHTIFVRGNYQKDVTANTPYFPDFPAPDTWSHPIGFVVGHAWTINSSMTNNFRYGLTREAFSDQGESTTDDVRFRSVFLAERLTNRTFSRVTPVTNITDDFSWLHGNHSFQFGTNIRIVRNERETFATSFDNGITNQSFYLASGNIIANAINQSLPDSPGCLRKQLFRRVQRRIRVTRSRRLLVACRSTRRTSTLGLTAIRSRREPGWGAISPLKSTTFTCRTSGS